MGVTANSSAYDSVVCSSKKGNVSLHDKGSVQSGTGGGMNVMGSVLLIGLVGCISFIL